MTDHIAAFDVLNLKLSVMTDAQRQRIIRKLAKKRLHTRRVMAPDVGSSDETDAIYDRVDREWNLLSVTAQQTKRLIRARHLAYCFLRNMGETPYRAIEAHCWTPPPWGVVETVIKFYAHDNREAMQKFEEWLYDAGVHLIHEKDGRVRDANWKQPPPKIPHPRKSDWIRLSTGVWGPRDED